MQQRTTPPAAAPAKPLPPAPPAEFQEGAIATMDAAALIQVLNDRASSEFQKSKACQRAGELGAKEAVPALIAMLGDPHLNVYARYGLEPIADPSVDDALRAALPKYKGDLQIGIMNSIGKRRDPKAGPVMAKMMYDSDPNVARAAASALGKIGGTAAMKDLQAALGKTTGLTKIAVADACLACAERFLEDGKREEALKMYAFLSAPDVPKAARLAAMSGIIREETNATRHR